ncbi:MAG: radical SAM protein [Candidatus Omnitrophica bacterium]|nr:radical SAM protein [Candidatus Omnitrophota bacterium]
MKDHPKLLFADKHKKVYDLPGVHAAGMKGGEFFRLDESELIALPPDSEIFMVPDRMPVGYDSLTSDLTTLECNPFSRKKEPIYAVAAFVAPGYSVLYNSAYTEMDNAGALPLFCYSAVAFHKGGFYVPAVKVDLEKRQVLRYMDMDLIKKNVKAFRRLLPGNRLARHLEICALIYGCPAAKNFFQHKYEGPLPTSPKCNALCLGCISFQPGKKCSVTQERIKFVPSPAEIAEVALFHLGNTDDPVVSFGQGCEGEPLLVGDTLIETVKMIRAKTSKGVINLNTNASRPRVIKELFTSGLDSIRVSMNSVQKKYYELYYRPGDYRYEDVIDSIKQAKAAGGFVSINYLTMPGFTDHRDEADSLKKFLIKNGPDMIQWRNLNYDPARYFAELGFRSKKPDMLGIDKVIDSVAAEFPGVMKGYFNPSKGRIKRFRDK